MGYIPPRLTPIDPAPIYEVPEDFATLLGFPISVQQRPTKEPRWVPRVYREVPTMRPFPACVYCGRDRSRDGDATCPGCAGTGTRIENEIGQPSLVSDPQIIRMTESTGPK